MRVQTRDLQCTLILVTVSVLAYQSYSQTALIGFGERSAWKYKDDGLKPPEDWMTLDFDDSSWGSGFAPLGYGDEGLNTVVEFGGNPNEKHITTHFRHRIFVTDGEEFENLIFLVRSDDGIVIYLNGDELLRNNMPDGAIDHKSLALKPLGSIAERLYRRFHVPASTLGPGINVVAVEVHQADARSSDEYLDISLRAYRPEDELRPTLRPHAFDATTAYHKGHQLNPETFIPDGFVDGGRGMKIDEMGNVSSRRELIVVDRTRDEFLRVHLRNVRSRKLRELEPEERAVWVAEYVYTVTSLGNNAKSSMALTSSMVKEFEDVEMLLGEIPRIGGAGVCRHMALLFKLLAYEANLDVSMVRGNLSIGENSFGHAWNVLHLKDGRRVLVDVTNGYMEELDSDGAPRKQGYLTVENKPWRVK